MTLEPGGDLDVLIERVLRGEATGADEERLDAWRRAAPGNEEYYRRTERLLTVARGMRQRGVVPPRPGAGAIVAASEAADSARRARWAPARWLPWSVAAAAVLVAAIGLLADRDTPAWAPAEVVTGANELATIALGDGTVVRLAPSSRLRVQPDRYREVSLEGRAFFAVTRSADRPFRVHTAAATARVLGTRFELATEPGGARLRVVEGRVAFGTRVNTVEVSAGEESGVENGAATTPTRAADHTAAPAWLGEFIAFQSTPLSDAAREIGRLYSVDVIIEDSTLAHATITASFTDQPLDSVLDVVCSVLDAQCARSDGVVSIRP